MGMAHVTMKHMLPPFNFVQLEPCNANDAHANVDFVLHLESDQEALTTTLEVGDHFVVIVEEGNMEGCDFWILICEEPLHEVEDEMKKNNWGQVVYQGEKIVIRSYYKQQGKSLMSYLLSNGRFAMIYLHLIFATKFNMEVTFDHQKGGKHGGSQVNFIIYQIELFVMLYLWLDKLCFCLC
jgi:hypothetical protein